MKQKLFFFICGFLFTSGLFGQKIEYAELAFDSLSSIIFPENPLDIESASINNIPVSTMAAGVDQGVGDISYPTASKPALPYHISVSPSGAAMVEIPIEVPAGRGGIQPHLSLIYNNQDAGSGILGKGWSLSGIPTITRVGQTIHRDGKNKEVTLGWSDRFALNGNRLLKTSGNYDYGCNELVYELENPDFSKIVSFGNSSTHYGPLYFEQTTKDGTIIHYGNSTDSRTSALSNKIEYAWYINKVRDVNGNYMSYNYLYGLHRRNIVSNIMYTGNDIQGTSPYVSIQFFYTYKEDSRSFIGGGEYG